MRLRRSEPRTSEPAIHSGVLFKRGYGRRWKPRHFVLTASTLRCFTFENGKRRGEMDLTQCTPAALEIMPADAQKRGRSKSTIWRLALHVPRHRRLLVAAPTEREMNAWIQHLTAVLRANADRLKQTTKEPHPTTAVGVDAVPDKELASSWKSTTTDFANFVAQPRRSVIFRRYSFESRPIVPGVYYRHSTGQISDDAALQQELAALRGEVVNDTVLQQELAELRRDLDDEENNNGGGNDDDDEFMDDEEEEALLRALRAFSLVRSEAGESTPPPLLSDDEDNASECLETPYQELPSPVRTPIFYYKKPEPVEEGGRPLTTKPRRYSTGSTYEWGQWPATAPREFEFEPAAPSIMVLDQSSASESNARPSSDTQTLSSGSSAATGVGDGGRHERKPKWFKRLRNKWHARREERARSKQTHEHTPVEAGDAQLARISDELVQLMAPEDSGVRSAVLHVVNNLLREVCDVCEATGSECRADEVSGTPASDHGDRPMAQEGNSDIPVADQGDGSVMEQAPDPPDSLEAKKPHLLRRWHDKLLGGKRSRRFSTGDMMPDTAADEAAAIDPGSQDKAWTDDALTGQSGAMRFSTKLRRSDLDRPTLIELQPIEGDQQPKYDSSAGGRGDTADHEEEIVVVVVRRSAGESGCASSTTSKKITYRVYLDVNDSDDELRFLNPLAHAPAPRVCAA